MITTSVYLIDSYENLGSFAKYLQILFQQDFMRNVINISLQHCFFCFRKVCSSCSHRRQNPCAGRSGEGWAERLAGAKQFAGEQGNAAWRWSLSHVCRTLWQTSAGREMSFGFSIFVFLRCYEGDNSYKRNAWNQTWCVYGMRSKGWKLCEKPNIPLRVAIKRLF